MIRPPRKPLLLASFVLSCLLNSCERKEQTTSGTPPASALPEHHEGRSREPQAAANGALASAAALENKDESRLALEKLVWDHADDDLQLSCEAFDVLRKDGPPPAELTAFLAGKLTASDPESAVAWAKSLSRNENRDAAYAQIAVTLGGTSPKHAAEFAVKYLPPGSGHDQVFIDIASQWAEEDAPSAAKWVGRFPEGEARKGGLKAVIFHWSEPAEAAPWIGGIPDQTVRDEALAALADVLKTASPHTSEAWLESLPDEQQRQQLRKLMAP